MSTRPLTIAPLLALALAVAAPAPARADDAPKAGKQAKILTAEKDGTYHALALSLKEALGAVRLDVGLSGGSGENLLMTSLGAADFSLVQLDLLGVFASDPDYEKVVKRVKLVAPLYFEEVHIIVRREARIAKFEDFKGKRVNVGPGASGSYFSALILLKQHGIDEEHVQVDHGATKDAVQGLLAGKLDAVFFTGGQPVGHFQQLPADAAQKLALFSMPEDETKRYQESDMPYYAAQIAGGTYPWAKETVYTVATPCLLLANVDADEGVVFEVAKTVFSKKDELAKKHPKWGQVKVEVAKEILDGKQFPFHPGAVRYLTGGK